MTVDEIQEEGHGGVWADVIPWMLPLIGAGVVFAQSWVTDDAYITFHAVDNLLSGHGPVFNAGERVQAYTHPLWFMLLTAGTALGIGTYYVALFLGIAAAYGLFWVVTRLLSPALALLVAAFLLSSLEFVAYETSGLETSLTHLLVAAMVFVAYRGVLMGSARWPLEVTVLAGLVLLNRLDQFPLVLPIVLLALSRRPIAIIGFAPLGVWLLFSTWYYGTPLPNTAYAKVGAYPLTEAIGRGLTYVADLALNEPFLVIAAAAGIVLALHTARRSWRGHPARSVEGIMAAFALGVVLQVGMVIYLAGDFMRGRMLLSAVLVALLVGAVALRTRRLNPVIIGGVIIVLAVMSTGQMSRMLGPVITPAGIAEERGFYQVEWLGLRRGSTAPEDGVARLGNALRRYADAYGPIAYQAGAIGRLSYLAGPDVHILDGLGLTDAYVARQPVRPHARPGHIEHYTPRAYYRSQGDISQLPDWETRLNNLDPTLREDALVMQAETVWADPDARRHYEAIREVISGPLSSVDRLTKLLDFTLGLRRTPEPDMVLVRRGDITIRANYFPVFGNFSRLVDAAAPDGTPWDDETAAVALNDDNNWVEVDFGSVVTLTRMTLQADHNDSYFATFSEDRRDFGDAWAALPTLTGGLATRATPDGWERTARYLRITVKSGDRLYSLGALRFLTADGSLAIAPTPPRVPVENAIVTGDSSLTLNWLPPQDDGGAPITGYRVESSDDSINLDLGPVNTVTIDDLENGKPYEFVVYAVSDSGESGPSPAFGPAVPQLTVQAQAGPVTVRANYKPRHGTFDNLLGPYGEDGFDWADPTRTVAVNDDDSWILIDLGDTRSITGIRLQADNNDGYIVTFSTDGETFGNAWVVSLAAAPGVRTRETPTPFEREARFMRIQPRQGDGVYSLGAIDILGPDGPIIPR